MEQIDKQGKLNLNYQIQKKENISDVLYVLRKIQHVDDLVTLAWLYNFGIGV